MKARITTDSDVTSLELDGHDFSYAATGATLHLAAGATPKLRLDLALLDTVDVSGEVHVHIPEATRQALIDLGWTPPEEDQ